MILDLSFLGLSIFGFGRFLGGFLIIGLSSFCGGFSVTTRVRFLNKDWLFLASVIRELESGFTKPWI